MYCKNCGNVIPAGNQFCNSCGTPVDGGVNQANGGQMSEMPMQPNQGGENPNVRQAPVQVPPMPSNQVSDMNAEGNANNQIPLVAPVQAAPVNPVPPVAQPEKKNNTMLVIILIIIIIILIIIIYFLMNRDGGTDNNGNTTTTTTTTSTTTTTNSIANTYGIRIYNYTVPIPSGYEGKTTDGKYAILLSDTTGIMMYVGMAKGTVSAIYTQVDQGVKELEEAGATNVVHEKKTRNGQESIEFNYNFQELPAKQYIVGYPQDASVVVAVSLVDVNNNPASVHESTVFSVVNSITKNSDTFATTEMEEFAFNVSDVQNIHDHVPTS